MYFKIKFVHILKQLKAKSKSNDIHFRHIFGFVNDYSCFVGELKKICINCIRHSKPALKIRFVLNNL